MVRECATIEIVPVGCAVQDGAGCAVVKMDASEEPVNRLDIGSEKRLVLGELGARHGVKVRRRRGVAEVEGTGRVDEALLKALQHEGAVLKVVDRGKYKVMLQDEAVVELDLLGGKLGDGRVELGSLPHGDGWGERNLLAPGIGRGRRRSRSPSHCDRRCWRDRRRHRG